MDVADFSNAQRQFAVAMHIAFIKKHAAGAVHRLNGEIALFNLRGEHVLAIVGPVAGAFPQFPDHRKWGFDFDIVAAVEAFADRSRSIGSRYHPFRMDERHAGSLFFQGEKIQLWSEDFVVALFGLFEQLLDIP